METRIKQLEKQIIKHQELYYNKNPEISDEEFDSLWDELKTLDPQNPILSRVGEDATDGFKKAKHIMPMGSQEKASDPESFEKWAEKIGHKDFLVQFKLDGASLELQYDSGSFVKAVTRGDGKIGDDISENAKKMKGCVQSIEKDFSGGIRGEVIMLRSVRATLYPDAANCRNAANGLMKRKDGSGSEDLCILCYDAVHADNPEFFKNESEKLEWINKQGFSIVRSERFSSPSEVIAYRAKIMDKRPSMDFDIDGLVVKNDEIDIEDMKRSRPEKQIAFKFSLEEAISILREVEWSESGATFTPIGIIDPVSLAGTTVKRANLCNPNMLRELDLKIGSRIIITKRGEIIPKIEGLVVNPEGSEDIPIPNICSCGVNLVDEGTRLYCPNEDCPKKAFHRLEKWVATLGIMDFGSTLLKRLFDSGRVNKISDLYTLDEAELARYERMGEILAKKLIKNLRSISEISLQRLIAGFDIEGVGELIAEKLVMAGYATIDSILNADEATIKGIHGIGDALAKSIITGINTHGDDMKVLVSNGYIKLRESFAGPLAGKSFCFTGELQRMKRDQAEILAKEAGATIKSSVTKDLDYLVTNDAESGSSKNKKARELGIPIISEDEFFSMVGR